MDQRTKLGLVAIAGFSLAIAGNGAAARQESLKDQLVGTWMVVSCEVVNADGTRGPLVFGRNPLGQFIFTDNGRFAFQIAAELPKFASGDYRRTTPQENETVVKGSMAYFGTYTTTDTDRTIALHVERSSIPNLNGTDGKRVVTGISADDMKWTNPAPIGGGSISCANTRVK
jgi:hypothetical protein